MSAMPWISASQVTRSCTGSMTGEVSSVSAGSSIHASGKWRTQRSYSTRAGAEANPRALVEPLQVDRLDRARVDQLEEQLLRPVRRRVELETQRRVALEPAHERLRRGRIAEPQRHHE